MKENAGCSFTILASSFPFNCSFIYATVVPFVPISFAESDKLTRRPPQASQVLCAIFVLSWQREISNELEMNTVTVLSLQCSPIKHSHSSKHSYCNCSQSYIRIQIISNLTFSFFPISRSHYSLNYFPTSLKPCSLIATRSTR